jgi:hypothetical protein
VGKNVVELSLIDLRNLLSLGIERITDCLSFGARDTLLNKPVVAFGIARAEIEGTEELPTATDGELSGAPEPATTIADRKWDCRRLFPNGQSKIIAATSSDAAGLHTVDPREG